jgi:flagellar hook assembly protein FlgD
MRNVINPLRGERVYLNYVLERSGRVMITVFDLKGDVVDVLYRGARAAGHYSTTWDGRNRGGRVVARGVYFVRLIGPGFDETRKVLVVK